MEDSEQQKRNRKVDEKVKDRRNNEFICFVFLLLLICVMLVMSARARLQVSAAIESLFTMEVSHLSKVESSTNRTALKETSKFHSLGPHGIESKMDIGSITTLHEGVVKLAEQPAKATIGQNSSSLTLSNENSTKGYEEASIKLPIGLKKSDSVMDFLSQTNTATHAQESMASATNAKNQANARPLVSNQTNLKPVIAICTCAKSRDVDKYISKTTLQRVVNSLKGTILDSERKQFDFRFYYGFDDDDEFWLRNYAKLDAPPWLELHPIVATKQNGSRVPFNAVCLQPYLDNSDYIVRINDDTIFQNAHWAAHATTALKGFSPPNVGVVGPRSRGDKQVVLTHDMTHRTHVDIFGFYYPPYFSAWYVDDWITRIYRPRRMRRLANWRVLHRTELGTRYIAQIHEKDKLEELIASGKDRLNDWLQTKQNGELIQVESRQLPLSRASAVP